VCCRDQLAGSFYKRHAVRAPPTRRTWGDATPPTAWGCWGSGSLSSPLRGAFHLSLTVLVHYRWPGRIAALEGGPPRFPQDFSCPVVLRFPVQGPLRSGVAYGTLTPSGAAFQAASAVPLRSVPLRGPESPPAGPKARRDGALQPRWEPREWPPTVWAAARFARHYSGPLWMEPKPHHLLISRPRGTEMFQFPRFPTSGLCIQPAADPGLAPGRVAPFGSGRLIARLQLPAHVSPLSASFFGAWPLGILPTPYLAWLANLSGRLPSLYSRVAFLIC
jgi:hypothetical protein